LEALTRTWAIELAPHGIRVNAVSPGPTETEALAESGLDPALVESIKEREARRIPFGRRGRPDEIAQWILNFASPGSRWVTGQVIDVDGGMGMHTPLYGELIVGS
jgi:NAD(P)-dependent dehydrogenase (short-subunit alcohol dehydrogenase family)